MHYYEINIFNKTQIYLNYFMFFLPLTFVKIAGISITFFIFIFICVIFLKNNIKIFKFEYFSDILIFIFFSLLILSLIFSEETYRAKNSSDLKLSIQMIYWFILALFIKTWAHNYNFFELSKYFMLGMIVAIISYFISNLITQNSFAYMLVLSTPFIMFYLIEKYSRSKVLFFSTGIIIIALASGSRTGGAIVILEILLLLFIGKIFSKNSLIKLFPFLVILIIILFLSFNSLKPEISDFIRIFNPELADLINNTTDVLEKDKSWLERKQYILKGLLIFEEHPFLGIGASYFKYYWVDMPVIPALGKSLDFLNRHSPHNSYIQILAGSGIFALVTFLFIQLKVLLKNMKYIFMFKNSKELIITISFIGLTIYFYVIANAYGSITWVVIGFALSSLKTKDKNDFIYRK